MMESGPGTILFKQANDGGPARTLLRSWDSNRCYSDPGESQSLTAIFPSIDMRPRCQGRFAALGEFGPRIACISAFGASLGPMSRLKIESR